MDILGAAIVFERNLVTEEPDIAAMLRDRVRTYRTEAE